MKSFHKYIAILGLSLLTVLSSCKKNHGDHDYHSVIDKFKHEGENYHGVDLSSDSFYAEYDLMQVSENGQVFYIPERKSKIKSFECTECHIKPLNQMKMGEGQKAHWDIEIVHANAQTMNCTTCHNGENLNELQTFTGSKVDFNNSYNVCSQCHNQQYKDWTGGAHGKSMGSWAPPRASFTCVNCHNPHNPSFESKWPARFNTQMLKERE
ncbi:multiheme c-type cytochrome [Urechidicola sp. KH5]